MQDADGSSPLARGLPPCLTSHCRGRGIIPARAGFTLAEQESNGENVGSSPLARGLLDREERVGPVVGIIPARAGFTSADGPDGQKTRDHPRSRGVY